MRGLMKPAFLPGCLSSSWDRNKLILFHVGVGVQTAHSKDLSVSLFPAPLAIHTLSWLHAASAAAHLFERG